MHCGVRGFDDAAGDGAVSSKDGCWNYTMHADPKGRLHLSRRGISNNLADGMASVRALCYDIGHAPIQSPNNSPSSTPDAHDAVVEWIVSFYEFLRGTLHHESKRPPTDPLWPLPFWHGLDMQGKDWKWLCAAHGRLLDLGAEPLHTPSPCTLSLTTDGLRVTYIGDVVAGLPHGYGVAFYCYAYGTHPSACGWSEGLWMGGARHALLSCGSGGWHSLMDDPAVSGDSVRGVTTHHDGKRTEAFWHDSILSSTPLRVVEKRRSTGLPYLWTSIAQTPSPPLFDPDRSRAIVWAEGARPAIDDITKIGTLLSLPNELLVAILAKLDGFDLGRFSTVCRAAALVASDDHLWKSAFQCSFGAIYDDLLCEFVWASVETKGYPLSFARAADTGRSWRWLFRAHASYYDPADPRGGPCVLDADHYVRPYLTQHDSRERSCAAFGPRSQMTIYVGDIATDDRGRIRPCGYGVMLKCRDLTSVGQSTERDRVRAAFDRLADRIPSGQHAHDERRRRIHNYQPPDVTRKRPGLLSWREIIVPPYDRLCAGFSVGLLSKGSHRGYVHVADCPSARGEIGYGYTAIRKRSAVVRGSHRSGKPFGRHDHVTADGDKMRIWWTGGGVKSRHMAKVAVFPPGHPCIRKSACDGAAKTLTITYTNGDRLELNCASVMQATLTCSPQCLDHAYASRVILCKNVAEVPAECYDTLPEEYIAGNLAICATGRTPDDEALRDYIRRGFMGWGPAHNTASMTFQARIDTLIEKEE
nr:F-box domain protein [Pandoravirus massiliensis]